MNLRRQLFITVGTLISLVILSVMVSAQDATQIPIVTTEEEDSGDLAPPPITGEEGVEVEVTAAPEGTEAVTPIDTNVTTSTCPVAVQDAYSATELICTGLASGEGCIGNGRVSTTFGAEVDGLDFANPDDRVRLTSIDQLSLSSSEAWTVVTGRLELETKAGNPVAADIILFGDVTLSDAGQTAEGGARNATVIAERGMNVRRTPANDGVVVWQLQGGEEVIVTGITADRVWIRIVIPNDFAGTGWVYAPYLEVDGGDETLPVVNENSPVPNLAPPEFGAMQSLELLSASTPEECGEGLPHSGMIMQSPSGTSSDLRFQINGVIVEFNGTIFIRAQASRALVVYILEGAATLVDSEDNRLGGVVNEELSAPLDDNLVPTGAYTADNYDVNELAGLPTNLLPRVIAFGLEPIIEEPETSVDTAFATNTPEGFAPVGQPSECILTAPSTGEARNIRNGPGTLYGIIRNLEPSETIRAVGQLVGELNYTWYQTDTGGWIREDSVEASDGCDSLPVVEAPAPPPATATPSGPSLSSPNLAAFTCTPGAIANTASATSSGNDFSIAIGGTWSVSAGTTVNITVQGGQLRPEFGDFIQIQGEDGSFIAGSGESHSLRFTFTESRTFITRFSAGNGDLVVIAVACE